MPDQPVSAHARLRARLEKLEWSQNDLAHAIGVAPSVVSRWVRGDRAPSLEMAFRIERSKIGIEAEAWIHHAEADESGPHAAVPSTKTG